MRKLTWLVLNRDAEQFTFVLAYVTVASYNASFLAVYVVYNSSQIVLVNLIFAIRILKHLKSKGT